MVVRDRCRLLFFLCILPVFFRGRFCFCFGNIVRCISGGFFYGIFRMFHRLLGAGCFFMFVNFGFHRFFVFVRQIKQSGSVYFVGPALFRAARRNHGNSLPRQQRHDSRQIRISIRQIVQIQNKRQRTQHLVFVFFLAQKLGQLCQIRRVQAQGQHLQARGFHFKSCFHDAIVLLNQMSDFTLPALFIQPKPRISRPFPHGRACLLAIDFYEIRLYNPVSLFNHL